ncbi:MAG: thiolase domain-containing protein [Candidatus Aenigmarchaeota archaeon]|nr:thiolase domain-containing protein [Candidatus Aenigmarchaeota archaeon]
MALAIIGTGITKFGELWDMNWEDLVLESSNEAMKNANIETKDINSCYIGNMNLSRFEGQDHVAPRITEILGINKVIRTEAACASSSVALKLATNEIEASLDKDKIALVTGFEKMTDRLTGATTSILASASHYDTEVMNGATFPGLYALIAARYLHETDATEEDLHAIAIKNHRNALENEKAMFRKELNLNAFKGNIASPLKLLDCSPISDGAASLIVTTEKLAKEIGTDYVKLEGIDTGTSTISLAKRQDLLVLDSAKRAVESVYKKLNLGPKDIDLIEVHDCFTINEILCLEAAGFAKRGEGYKIVRSLMPYNEINNRKFPVPYLVDGRELFVNTSGGLKAKGHPVGATGVAQVIEVANQLMGKCGKRNANPKTGAALNIGGTGGTATFSVLRGGI